MEGNEAFTLSLASSNSTAHPVIGRDSVTVAIIDNDGAPQGNHKLLYLHLCIYTKSYTYK